MHKRSILGVMLALAFCVMGMALTTGCSESKDRRASRELLESVDKAHRLHERALALMANPAYLADDENADPQPGDSLHPEVLGTLNRAARIVTKALQDLPEPKDAASELTQAKAQAQIVLAHVQSLQGYCHTTEAYRAIDAATDAGKQVEIDLAAARAKGELFGFFRKLASADSGEIQSSRDRAARSQAQASANVQSIQATIAKLQATRQQQNEAYGKYNSQASAAAADARDTPGEKGLDELEKALEIREKANAAEAEIARIERELDTRMAELQAARLAQSSSADQVAVFDKLLAQHANEVARMKAKAAGAKSQLDAATAKLAASLSQVVATCDQAVAAMNRSTAAYDKARRQAQSAGRAKTLDAASLEAAIWTAIADVKVRVLNLQEQNHALASRVKAVWVAVGAEAPADLQKIVTILPDPDKVREDIIANYEGATRLRRKAGSGVDREHRWSYDGQTAIAFARLYQVTRDPKHRDEAIKLVQQISQGKEYSPFIAPIVRAVNTRLAD